MRIVTVAKYICSQSIRKILVSPSAAIAMVMVSRGSSWIKRSTYKSTESGYKTLYTVSKTLSDSSIIITYE